VVTVTTDNFGLKRIPVDDVHIEGMLELPPNAQSVVLFAHGSGSSRHSPRNNYVARALRDKGIGTLLLDLLTVAEDMDYQTRFDIPLLTHRLRVATHWVKQHQSTRHLPIG
jgi:putative phosphoribosyl transferase